jgi:hypothetical protein
MCPPSMPTTLAPEFPCKLVLAMAFFVGCNTEPPLAHKGGVVPVGREPISAPPAANKTDAEIASEFSIAEPSLSEPVTAAMRLDPASATPGAKAELLVYARIATAHFVHAASVTDQVFSPVEISVSLPPELEAQGEWSFPSAANDRSGSPVYRDSILLRRPLKFLADADPRTYAVNGELKCQVCTDDYCWPLKRIELSTSFTIPPFTR